jgi:membrane associated rhomboid family serine protease
MRSRYPTASSLSYSFGPGPLTPAIKALIGVNTALFVVSFFVPLSRLLGLWPADVVHHYALWRVVTYMFVHAGPMHLLFNMLTLWMFGVELERMWGTTYFTKFYFVSGIGAGLVQMLLGLVPSSALQAQFFDVITVGASGAIYGVLLAYAIYFPNRPILFFGVFPLPAKIFVLILGALALLFATGGGGGVAHTAHLGGLLAGYLYLKGGRMHLFSELQYRYLKWRINRTRRRFDVYSGGRADDVDRRVH